MSGTGKSTVLGELQRHGFRVVDTDEPGWTEWSEGEDGYVWNEERIAALLAEDLAGVLYVSGAVSNQGRFYARFDAVVLLSAPAEVIMSRVLSRTTNSYGRTAHEREQILRDLAEAEPRMRATCTHEIDATQPIGDVVTQLIEIGAGTGPGLSQRLPNSQ
jgi:dephospho-CoA kinase